MRNIAFLIVFGLSSINAFALDVFGAGASSCAKYLTYKKDGANAVVDASFRNWAYGYISSANVFRCPSDNCIELDREALDIIADQYCTENPLNVYMDAVIHYIVLMDEKKGYAVN